MCHMLRSSAVHASDSAKVSALKIGGFMEPKMMRMLVTVVTQLAVVPLCSSQAGSYASLLCKV